MLPEADGCQTPKEKSKKASRPASAPSARGAWHTSHSATSAPVQHPQARQPPAVPTLNKDLVSTLSLCIVQKLHIPHPREAGGRLISVWNGLQWIITCLSKCFFPPSQHMLSCYKNSLKTELQITHFSFYIVLGPFFCSFSSTTALSHALGLCPCIEAPRRSHLLHSPARTPKAQDPGTSFSVILLGRTNP